MWHFSFLFSLGQVQSLNWILGFSQRHSAPNIVVKSVFLQGYENLDVKKLKHFYTASESIIWSAIMENSSSKNLK